MRSAACLTTIGLLIAIAAASISAQAIPFDSDRWEFQAGEKRIEEHLGRKSLYLKEGTAIVKDSQFADGTIEFDIAFSAERNFAGVIWRVKDARNYEEFYFRPHQSGNPDANQYQPVFNGGTAWQLLYGPRYSAPVKYDFDQWIRVKIVVSGNSAEVYIKDMNTPALFINELMHDSKQGRVGLTSGNPVGAYFSDFSFTPAAAPVLKGKPQREAIPAGTVPSWQVSSPFDAKLLDAKYRLTDSDKRNLTWKQLPTDGGFANLSRLQGTAEGRNTVFARMTIRSDTEQVKRVRFGFSDLVKVYFNDALVYGGSDLYRSRDYRFLGTVGLFDELYLPLKKGDNEIWFAVTENFGGWIIGALFDDMSGIAVNIKP